MSSKLLINVNDATPTVVPDTNADTNVPDTGVFSTIHNDGVNNTSNMIAPIIGISILAIVLVALVISLVKKHKQKKTNKFSIYSKGHTILRITGIMTLILITTFVALNYNVKQEDNVNAADNTLTVTTSDIEIDVDLNDKPVFATGESIVTVDSATTAGYTLMAYVDSTTTNLTNETNASSTSTISMLESTYSQALTDNTWGMAITKPTSQEDTLFRGLPTTEKEAMTIKVASDATTANDKTTIYYSTYITPDLDFGTYSGATITYIAVANVAEDDVTVNYHMPGDVEHIFVKSGDTRFANEYVNTVAYNKSQELAYMGDNCGTSYVGTEPAAIVKTNNLNNDGVQNGGYLPIDTEPISLMGADAYLVAYQVVNVSGADDVKININYKMTNAFIAVFEGEWSKNDLLVDDNPFGINADALAKSQLIIPMAYPDGLMEGESEYAFSGDTITVAVAISGSPEQGYDYGLFAKVFPIYAEQPDGITTSEKITCYSTKSSEMFSKWDEVLMPNLSDNGYYSYQVLAPGAKKIKVEIDYGLGSELSPSTGLIIAEGSTGVFGYSFGAAFGGAAGAGISLMTYNEAVSGFGELYFDGDTVSFIFASSDSVVEGRDFEFDIKAYPIYDQEYENTVPINMDTVVRKSGSYGESVGHAMWRYNLYSDDSSSYGIPLSDERSVKLFVGFYYDDFAGRIVDVYERL